jgi:N-acetyl-gamma-glutamyl-phosphate reductase
MKIGIINVTGYAGIELARILHRHPEAEVVSVTGRSAAGESLGDTLPHLARLGMTIEPEITRSVDIVFSALPQIASAEACVPFVRDGVKVVDISADFRLHDPAEYLTWYGKEHPAPDLLETSVYGLPELDRQGVIDASLIANPGCYANCALLALAPVVAAGLITDRIIVDAKSGVSGAGRGLSMTTHFSEVNENVFAYAVDGHRHLPEITQELKRLRPGFDPQLTFVPHLIPMTRGIHDSVYADFVDGAFASPEAARGGVREVYREYYRDQPFVHVVDAPPQTKQTWGNNDCLIDPVVDVRTGRLTVFAVLDNLVKGAAGQAVQNMNLMFGLPETTGLEQLAIYP